MNLSKTKKTVRSLYGVIYFFFILSCTQGVKNFQLHPDSTGNVALAGADTADIQKIVPITPGVIEHIEQPKSGVTRLIVQCLREGQNPVFNIFDINYSGTLTIQGNGYYRFSKDESSNTWRLDISADNIQEFSVYEGVAPDRLALGNITRRRTVKIKHKRHLQEKQKAGDKPEPNIAQSLPKDSNTSTAPQKTLPAYSYAPNYKDVPAVFTTIGNHNYFNYYPGRGGILFWTNCKNCAWQVSIDGGNYRPLLGAFDLTPAYIYNTTPFYQFAAGKLINLNIKNKDEKIYGKWHFVVENGKTLVCKIIMKPVGSPRYSSD